MVSPTVEPALDVEEERRLVELAMRPAAMRSRLAAAADVDPASACHVLDVKYEARRSATVLYQVGATPVTVVLSLAGGPVRNGVDGGGMGGGVAIGPAMHAYVFPCDPALASLPALVDPAVMAKVLTEALGEAVISCQVEVIRYRPAKRATLHVGARLRAGRGTVALRVIAKIYSSGAKAASVYEETQRLTALVDSGAGQVPGGGRSALKLASALAFVADGPMIVQSSLPGTPLEDLLVPGPSGRADPAAGPALAAAARAVAALHRLPPVSTRIRSAEKELARFAQRAGAIAVVEPASGVLLGEATALLTESYRRLPAAPIGLVHGDCKPSQFLLGGPDVGLLDFDHCGLADPVSDVGAFLAALRKTAVTRSLREPRRPRPETGTDGHRLERTFLETYGREAGDQTDLEERVRWHQGAALVRKALRAFARAPRSPLPAALAAEGIRCLTSDDR